MVANGYNAAVKVAYTQRFQKPPVGCISDLRVCHILHHIIHTIFNTVNRQNLVAHFMQFLRYISAKSSQTYQ